MHTCTFASGAFLFYYKNRHLFLVELGNLFGLVSARVAGFIPRTNSFGTNDIEQRFFCGSPVVKVTDRVFSYPSVPARTWAAPLSHTHWLSQMAVREEKGNESYKIRIGWQSIKSFITVTDQHKESGIN